MTYDQSGNYTVLAGLVVSIINHFLPYLGVTVNDVVAVIGAGAILIGAIRQYIAHRKLAVTVGAIGA